MNFDRAIERACALYPRHGRFELLPSESINTVLTRQCVPSARGIYVIFRRNDFRQPIYIGKAGTYERGNIWKDQGLCGRLKAKQNGVSRAEFFSELMREQCPDGLTFLWFVTHDGQERKTLPAFAEMDLIQAFYDQFGDLPAINKCV